MIYNIPIYGFIGEPTTPEEENEKWFSFADLLLHLNNSKDATILNLDINSKGGYCDVADKMIKALAATGKKMTSCNTGDVCSAASKLFTLPEKEDRYYYPDRGMFLIHNPWVEIAGDSEFLKEVAKGLKQTETEYATWYSHKTGTDINIINSFMAENVPLTSDQVEQLGFANIKKDINPKALLTLNSKTKMEIKQVNERLGVIETLLQSFKALLPKPKAMMIADANGNELVFPDITDIAELAVGVKTNAADGDYVLPDGTTLTVLAGVVTAITPKTDSNAEITALKAEIDNLKAEKAKLIEKDNLSENKLCEVQASFKEINDEFVKFKSEFTGFTPSPANPPAGGEQKSKSKFTYKRK